jgi:hypothetical protein
LTSSGAAYPIAVNNQITIEPGSYLITYAISNSNQTDFALTTSIASNLTALASVIPASHTNSQANRTFSPVSVVVTVLVTTNLYLVNFSQNASTLAPASVSVVTSYNLAYLSIIKLQ